MRPTTGPARKDGLRPKNSLLKRRGEPPLGMHINHDDLEALATGPQGQGEAILRALDREIVSQMRLVQFNKQKLSSLREGARAHRDTAEPYKVPESTTSSRINARWTNEELLLAVQGVRKFGKHFKVIAEILGTKTEAHVRSFFVNYKRRYNLDDALKEHEAEFGPSEADDDIKDLKEDLESVKPEIESDMPVSKSRPSSPRQPRSPNSAKLNGSAK